MTSIILGVTRFIIRSTGKLLGRDNDLDLWCNVSDIKNWQFGYEREGDPNDTREYWFGPLHLVTNTL